MGATRDRRQCPRIKVPPVAADPVDVIIKVELADPWNTSAVVPVEFEKGLIH